MIPPESRSVGLGMGYVRIMIVFGLDRLGVSSVKGTANVLFKVISTPVRYPAPALPRQRYMSQSIGRTSLT